MNHPELTTTPAEHKAKLMSRKDQEDAKGVLRLFAHHEISAKEAAKALKELNVPDDKAAAAIAGITGRTMSLEEVHTSLTMGTGTLQPGSPATFISPQHGLVSGDFVLLAGYDSTPAVNGVHPVGVIDPDHFTVNMYVSEVREPEGVWQKNPKTDVELMGTHAH